MANKSLTLEELQPIINMVNTGISYTKIAKYFGIAESTLLYRLSRYEELSNSKIRRENAHIKYDLTGYRSGNWSVIKFVGITSYHESLWLCECQCSEKTQKVLPRSSIIKGKTFSCGCLPREKYNLTGKIFGHLTVIKLSHKKNTATRPYHYWLCRCQCNKFVTVLRENLTSGHTKSCGCQRWPVENLIGQKFGNLTVINRSGYIGKHITWTCRCDCGNIIITSGNRLKTGNTTSCGHGRSVSRWEKEVKFYVKFLLGPHERILFNPRLGKTTPDIIIPDKKIIIECNGIYYHSAITGTLDDDPWRHYNRRKFFAQFGYRTIFLWEDDWEKRKIAIRSYLRNILSPKFIEIFDARKLEVKEVDHLKATRFLDYHHPQGRAWGKVQWLGLWQNTELIAVMGLIKTSRPVLSKKNTAELIRYASCGRVRGGASRLLHYWLKNNLDINEIVSFSDNDYFIGNMYTAIGFKYDGEVNPDYTTIWGRSRRHKSYTKRSNLLKLSLQEIIEFNPELMTEKSCLQLNGIRRAWNSGRKRWLYKNMLQT